MLVKSWRCLIFLLAMANAVRADVSATGGSATNDIAGYRIHTFTNNGTFSVASGGNVEVLVVAGGGGGGKWVGGGGGAGGFQTNAAFSALSGSYVVQIGAGGAKGADGNGPGGIGGDSVFSNGASFIVSKGGGGGGTYNGVAATSGGSGGGGGGGSTTGAVGIAGQGNHGGLPYNNQWAGGGGGGAGAPGVDATSSYGGAGGAGLASSISGVSTYYAGGGGGCSDGSNAGSNGGLGGGGKGRSTGLANPPQDGTPNTGGGGGGARDTAPAGYGGSGIVIIKYFLSTPAVNNANGATNVTLTSAWLNGTLVSTGASDTAMSIFWGASDAGTNGGPTFWANTNTWAAPQVPGLFTINVSGLASNSTYYYCSAASNAAGMIWASPSSPFITGEVWVDKTSDAAEQGVVPGTFTVHRASSATNAAITVNFAVGGSGVAGVDYVNNLGNSVTFAAGASNATVVVTPIINNASNSNSSVTLTILPGNYVVGTQSSATLTITNWAPPPKPATFWVNASSGDNTRALQLATNPATPWLSITYALTQASSGDTISVAAGTYTTPTETFPLTMKNGVILQGAGWLTTTINANGGIGISCSSISTGKIDGFTIKGAGPSDNYSGIRLSASSPVISNNRVTKNYNWRKGGGIWCTSGSNPLIKNNLIVANHAGSTEIGGGGIYIAGSSPTIQNCTIVGNSAAGSATAGGGIFLESGGTPMIRDSIIWQNGNDLSGISASMITNCDVGGGLFNGTNGCISADPQFVAGYLLSQTAVGQSTNSPCLNAGSQSASAAGLDTLSTRTDGIADGGQVDIGFHFPAGTNYGVTVYVAAGTGNNSYTLAQAMNPATPWKTITYALNQARFDWTINVATGLYNTTLGETFPLNLIDGVILQGAGYRTTIIQSAGNYKINCAYAGIGVVDGFSIQGGARNDFATAIYCQGSFQRISNCMIVSNWCWQGYAGGIYCFQGACPVIRNNVIAYNSADQAGTAGSISGIGCTDAGTCPIIENNTIAFNTNYATTAVGNGIGNGGSPIIRNCIVYSNTWPSQPLDLSGVTASMISYSDVGDGQFNTTNGCISANPLFAGASTNNFRLNAGSPCIDKGTNQSWMVTGMDLDGNPRLSGASHSTAFVDMGAYEYQYPLRRGAAVFFR